VANPRPFEGLPVLLVDDHPDVLVGVGAYLAGAGFDVTRVGTGDAALTRLLSGERFALLVTDYAMPGLSVPRRPRGFARKAT
jgi:CheY-like chemotaxis protein